MGFVLAWAVSDGVKAVFSFAVFSYSINLLRERQGNIVLLRARIGVTLTWLLMTVFHVVICQICKSEQGYVMINEPT